ncbi:hypothetical protein NKG94_16925 [Micromonospora sp. M12]
MGKVYWQAVLRYCAAGGLQAVLDEHLHTLRSSASDTLLDDDELWKIADEARQAMASRQSTYEAFDPHNPQRPIKLPGRFALRYGGRGESNLRSTAKWSYGAHSTAPSGRSSLPPQALARKASTSTSGARPSCTGTRPPTPSTSSNVRGGCTASAATPYGERCRRTPG